ncbi:hypothetical protein [Salinarimonas sp.]|uniref:capsular polysaccharide export protein, LipB/KpsS family n=1 Tax=Salinarimonas sp. TaxID=2766526 RepID=UPI0032D9051B
MNIVGLCQGANLKIFARLVEIVRERLGVDRIGVFAADAAYARRAPEAAALGRDPAVTWLREWESLAAGLSRTPDLALLRRVEAEIGPPSLWAGLLADRRLFFGRYCKFQQDYRPRYGERQLLGALTEAVARVEALFDAVRPDLVLGFVPVTLHEYVALRLAEARGVPILLLRSTKVENFVALNDRLFGLSRHVERLLPSAVRDPALAAVADRYLESTRARGAIYEGMHRPEHARRAFDWRGTARALAAAAKHEALRLRDPVVRADPHNPGYVVPALLERVQQPWRSARLRRLIDAQSGRSGEDDAPFCLFPLHFEPEIALQIYARPLQNQIEAARTLALSLPAGMRLLVKEHPRAAGFRPLSYYRKLLEIPNVRIAPPEAPSHALVRDAALVAVVTGNIGLEAAALGKPVIVLGEADYAQALPPSAMRPCRDLYALSSEIADLLRTHDPDDGPLRRLVAAIAGGAVPVDLYSVLLAKPGRHGFTSGDFDEDVSRLADYVESRIRAVRAPREHADAGT